MYSADQILLIHINALDAVQRRCLSSALGFWPSYFCSHESRVNNQHHQLFWYKVLDSVHQQARADNFPTSAKSLSPATQPRAAPRLCSFPGWFGKMASHPNAWSQQFFQQVHHVTKMLPLSRRKFRVKDTLWYILRGMAPALVEQFELTF